MYFHKVKPWISNIELVRDLDFLSNKLRKCCIGWESVFVIKYAHSTKILRYLRKVALQNISTVFKVNLSQDIIFPAE